MVSYVCNNLGSVYVSEYMSEGVESGLGDSAFVAIRSCVEAEAHLLLDGMSARRCRCVVVELWCAEVVAK